MTTSAAIPAGYAIEKVDLATASDDLVRQAVAWQQALDHERVPEDPPLPDQQIAARLRAVSKMWTRQTFVAVSGQRLVGMGGFGQGIEGSNLNHRDVWVAVLPDHRGRGLGRALFASVVAAIGEGDDVVVNGWTSDRVPSGGAFAERVGATPGLRMRTNQLDLATVDRALMRQWAALDPAGYRLEWIIGEVPDRLMDNVIQAAQAMNNMPREDLQMEDWVITPKMIREQERMQRERGSDHWSVLAIDPAGASAGFTDVGFDRRYLHVIQQRGTAVLPAHQGKGIGKWLKGRMVEKILAELPGARFIRTDNAGTNAPMLHINVAMGFRPAWENAIWQMPLATAQAYVRS